MNVRFGLACLGLLICCWCYTASSVSAASNGVRPRRQSRRATLNEYLTPPAPPNAQAFRGTGIPRHGRNQPYHGGSPPPQLPQVSGPPSPPFRNGKILTPLPTEAPGYFARLMGWLNPFGGPETQGSLPSHQQRPDNIQQQTFGSGHQQTLPPANGYGPPAAFYGQPAPSYGPPTNSYHGNTPRRVNVLGYFATRRGHLAFFRIFHRSKKTTTDDRMHRPATDNQHRATKSISIEKNVSQLFVKQEKRIQSIDDKINTAGDGRLYHVFS